MLTGRNGFQPDLALGYSTGAGNGPFGLGYVLDVLANRHFQYLTKTYLPRKLKERDWLD